MSVTRDLALRVYRAWTGRALGRVAWLGARPELQKLARCWFLVFSPELGVGVWVGYEMATLQLPVGSCVAMSLDFWLTIRWNGVA